MNFDLVIVGAGPVGASLARAARGLSVALVAQERHDAVGVGKEAFDARVYAISPGNVAFLEEIGAWQAISPEWLTPVHAMQVFGDDGRSKIEFDAYRTGVPELAWIVEDSVLQQALWRSLKEDGATQLFAPAACEALEVAPECATLSLQGGRALEAKLVVGADGARSFVRAQARIAFDERPYGQTAVVANFACERAHENVAYQWFQGGPVLALLPLPGAHVSMVWSLPDAQAAHLLELGPDELCREVEGATGHALGLLKRVTPPKAYPLRRLSARRLIAPRVALLGDAAHVIHPLAGQGANLGMQDARALAAVLAAREPMRDPGDVRLLRRYERARAEPLLSMRATVHGLYRLFDAGGGWLGRARNTGLNLADRVPVIKNLLVRRAMQ